MTRYLSIWYNLMVKTRMFFVTDGVFAEHRRGPKNTCILPTVWAQFSPTRILRPFLFFAELGTQKSLPLEGKGDRRTAVDEVVAERSVLHKFY